MTDATGKEIIDRLDVYIDKVKVGELAHITDDDPYFEGKGYYKFSYETYSVEDPLDPYFELSLNGAMPITDKPYYFLPQEIFRTKHDALNVMARPHTRNNKFETLSHNRIKFQKLPSLFYHGIPEGSLKESVCAVFKDIDFDTSILPMLSVTGRSAVGRVKYVKHGDALADPKKADFDIKKMMAYINDDKHESRQAAFVKLMMHFAENAGVSGQMPKFMALIDTLDLTANVGNEHKQAMGKKRARTSDYNDFVDYMESVAGNNALNDSLDINGISESFSGIDVFCLIKSEKAASPGCHLSEFLVLTAMGRHDLNVPFTHLSDDGRVLISPRFDMRQHGHEAIEELGFEDMTSIMDNTIDNIGKGFPVTIGETIDDICPLTGRNRPRELCKTTTTMLDVHNAVQAVVTNASTAGEELFMSFAVSNMVRNSDNHLRNYGVLYSNSRSQNNPIPNERGQYVELAPTYDVFCTEIFDATLSGSSLGFLRNVTETRDKPHTWMAHKDLLALGQKMTLRPRSSVLGMIETAVSVAESIVKDIMNDADLLGKRLTMTPYYSAVCMAMSRTIEEAVKTTMNGVKRYEGYSLPPCEQIQTHYNAYLQSLNEMPLEELANEYDTLIRHLNLVHIIEIVDIIDKRGIMPKEQWNLSTRELANVMNGMQVDDELELRLKELQAEASTVTVSVELPDVPDIEAIDGFEPVSPETVRNANFPEDKLNSTAFVPDDALSPPEELDLDLPKQFDL